MSRLKYSPNTGLFHRSGALFARHNGPTRGSKHHKGYYWVTYEGKQHQSHRLAFVLMGEELVEGLEVDHINGDRGDNRWCNLRQVTPRGNACNRPYHRAGGPVGVTWFKRDSKWRAGISFRGKFKHLGYFTDKEDAIKARRKAEKELL